MTINTVVVVGWGGGAREFFLGLMSEMLKGVPCTLLSSLHTGHTILADSHEQILSCGLTPPPPTCLLLTRFHASQGSADHVEPQLALLLPADPQRPGQWHFRSGAERRPVLGGLLRLSGR